MRLFGGRRSKVERFKEAGDAEALYALLDHGRQDDPAVRADAARALATLDGDSVETALAQALADPDRGVRHAAVEALAGREQPTAVDALLDALAGWPYSDDYAALEQAVAKLVEWSPDGAAERFARRLLDPEAPALDERHHDALIALLAVDPLGEAASERVADSLLTELGDGALAARAESMLMWLGPPAADSVLRALDGDRVSTATVRMAGMLGDSRAVDPLVGALGSPDAAVRSAAGTALGELNDTRAVQALIGATQDPDHDVRRAAADALDAMGVAAVIVGVASVMRDVVREQLREPAQRASGELDATTPNTLSSPEEAISPHPPTWAQEVLGRLLKRMGT